MGNCHSTTLELTAFLSLLWGFGGLIWYVPLYLACGSYSWPLNHHALKPSGITQCLLR